jgi:hypothetical protein
MTCMMRLTTQYLRYYTVYTPDGSTQAIKHETTQHTEQSQASK